MAKLTKQKAIAKYCKECSGNSSKEVTLCSILDCPLWEYRCGYHISSKTYKPRVQNAFRKYKQDVSELHVMGLRLPNFLPQGHVATPPGKNNHPSDEDNG